MATGLLGAPWPQDGWPTDTQPPADFLQKIVASYYTILAGYLESCLNELELSIRLTHVDKWPKHMTI